MINQRLKAKDSAFVAALKACAKKKDLCRGITLHVEILRRGLLETSPFVANTLVSMYAKCGALAKAQGVLDELPARDVVSWSALIAGYALQGQGHNALNCFGRMQAEGLSPDAITFSCILKACGSIRAADKGQEIHDQIAKQGLLGIDVMLGNALVDMYAKCGALAKAKQVLEELPVRDVVSWSTLIAGYALQGHGHEALTCFEQMQSEGLLPDAVTFISLLKACGSIGAADKGQQIHDKIIKKGLLEDSVMLGTALVDMYAKCGAVARAQRVLEELPVRNVVTWSALITGYTQQGQGQDALNCFERMQCDGLAPNEVTLLCTLKACGIVGTVDKGEEIHNELARLGLLGNDIVLGTALVDMYVKCGALLKARRVLEDLPVWDAVSWNALIAGYTQHGQGEEALNCFELMKSNGVSPDKVTFTCILKACGSIGAIDKGKQIHDEIVKQGLLGSCVAELGSALVDMYAKCGALAKAQQLLDELHCGDIVSWSALIAGYAQHRQCQDAFLCIERMQLTGLFPNAITFSCVLNACSHSGLVDEGEFFFVNMSTKYGITPDLEHYTCMIDMFGRAGHFDKAVALIERMPSSDHPAVWSALLGACRKQGDVKAGRWAFEHAVQVDKTDAATYIDMANIYTAAGMQRDAEGVEEMRMRNRAWRKPGLSR